jgi:hypothetical protein
LVDGHVRVYHGLTLNLPASVSFVHDDNGNMTGDGGRAFEYDDENQLVSYTRGLDLSGTMQRAGRDGEKRTEYRGLKFPGACGA